MIQGIRHIIFDLGGVLLNLDYHATARAFGQLGIADFDARFSQLQQNSFFDDWETGRMGREEFLARMVETAGGKATEQQVLDAWNAMLLDFPLRRIQLLQQLRLHYDLFLLSNTNEIHEEAFNRTLRQSHGLPGLATLFDKVYFSHRIGLRKPMKEIFSKVLDDNGLKAEHTLFIDDSPQHIETAKAIGIQAIFLEKGMTIEDHIFLAKDNSAAMLS